MLSFTSLLFYIQIFRLSLPLSLSGFNFLLLVLLMSSSSLHLRLSHLGFRKPPKQSFLAQSRKPPKQSFLAQSRIKIPFCSLIHRDFCNGIQFCGSQRKSHRNMIWRNMIITGSMGEDSMDSFSFNDWEDSDGISGGSSYILSSSGEDSDTEYLINPVIERDFSGTHDNFNSSDGALSMTQHLSMLRKRRKTSRIRLGVLINMGLIAFLVALLLFVDWCSWRIVRLPLPPFYLTRPFLISAALASCLGYVCIPIFDRLRIHQIFRKEGPVAHHRKNGTPTMGGLFFIPVGITVGIALASPSSVAVFGAAVATIAFAAIGLLDDLFSSIKNDNYGLPAWIKVLLEVAVGIWFSFWLNTTNISSPYSMKMLVPLPAPLGLVYLGKLYLFLTTFCFVSMGNGINLTDGLDGLAGGTAALAFIGMSIAVLPISSDLAIFGASMAGACIGFLVHNRYRASIFMGDTGSLALGGALAAMAACTGMFFPLFISSGIFVLEALSVIMQVLYFKSTRCWFGAGQRLFRMAPLHHHLELCGFREPLIVGSTYIISYILSIFAGYMGLISA